MVPQGLAAGAAKPPKAGVAPKGDALLPKNPVPRGDNVKIRLWKWR